MQKVISNNGMERFFLNPKMLKNKFEKLELFQELKEKVYSIFQPVDSNEKNGFYGEFLLYKNFEPLIREFLNNFSKLVFDEIPKNKIEDFLCYMNNLLNKVHSKGKYVDLKPKSIYFQKSGNIFTNYREIKGNLLIEFILLYQEPEMSGKHNPKRYFIPKSKILREKIPLNQDDKNFHKKSPKRNYAYRNSVDGKNIKFFYPYSQTNLCSLESFEPEKNEAGKKIHNVLQIYLEYRRLLPHEKEQFFRNYQRNINKWLLKTLLEELKDSIPSSNGNNEFLISKTSLYEIIKRYTKKSPPNKTIPKNISNYLNTKLEKFLKHIVIKKLYSDFEENLPHCTFDEYQELNEFIVGFKNIANSLFSLIVKFENLKKSLFLKKKFIFHSDYFLPLDLISSHHYEDIRGSERLLKSWDDLLELDSQDEKYSYKRGFVSRGAYLPVDTRYVEPPLREKILSQFDHFHTHLSGFLIKGENLQAMNLISPILSQGVDLIYTDPPYNTGTVDFIYDDNYQKSHWKMMMWDRIRSAQALMNDDGIFFSSIDDNELANYMEILEEIFPKRLYNIVWQKKTQPSYLSKELISVTEYILCAKNTEKSLELMGDFGNPRKHTELINIGNKRCVRTIPKDSVEIKKGWTGNLKKGNYGEGKLFVKLMNGPVSVEKGRADRDLKLETRFKWTQEKIEKEIKKGGKIFIKSIRSLRPTILRNYKKPIIKAPITLFSKKVNNEIPTNTDANKELKDLFRISPFDYSKPVGLIQYLIRAGTYYNKNATVMDFFAGSGTTAQATVELNHEDGGNRKCIIIEKNEYFNSVLIPRIQKIMYSQEWKKGKPYGDKGYKAFFKSISIEGYEDCFLNLKFIKADQNKSMSKSQQTMFKNRVLNQYTGFITSKDLSKFLKSEEKKLLCYEIDNFNEKVPLSLNVNTFSDPFSYMMERERDGILYLDSIDLVETFNFLLGLKVEKYFFEYRNEEKAEGDPRKYVIIHGMGKFYVNFPHIGHIDDKDKISNFDEKPAHNSGTKAEKEEKHLLIIWRPLKELDLNDEKLWLRKFMEKRLPNIKFDQILFNGKSSLKNGIRIEDIFFHKMFNLD